MLIEAKDTLHVAIDVSGNGQLSWPPSTQSSDFPTLFHGITLFLTSATNSKNFTISNGTDPDDTSSAYVGPVLDLEPNSTVKHVNWVWPACLVGDGDGDGDNSDRGAYNISVHQLFRLNETDYYTVFDLPISVSNGIEKSDDRVDCPTLENELLSPAEAVKSNDTLPGHPWVDGIDSGGDSDSGTGRCRGGVRKWFLVTILGIAGMMQL